VDDVVDVIPNWCQAGLISLSAFVNTVHTAKALVVVSEVYIEKY
jgi:hypothetical protein